MILSPATLPRSKRFQVRYPCFSVQKHYLQFNKAAAAIITFDRFSIHVIGPDLWLKKDDEGYKITRVFSGGKLHAVTLSEELMKITGVRNPKFKVEETLTKDFLKLTLIK